MRFSPKQKLIAVSKVPGKKIIIAGATMQIVELQGTHMIYYYFVVFGFATVVQHTINTMIVTLLTSTLR